LALWQAISPKPAVGPLLISRKSVQSFNKLLAQALRMPLTSTNTSAFCVDSTRFSARAKPIPVRSRKVPPRETCIAVGGDSSADGCSAEIHHP